MQEESYFILSSKDVSYLRKKLKRPAFMKGRKLQRKKKQQQSQYHKKDHKQNRPSGNN